MGVLRELVRDEALRVELGANARRRFASEYDAAISTARLVDTPNEARELFAGARSMS